MSPSEDFEQLEADLRALGEAGRAPLPRSLETDVMRQVVGPARTPRRLWLLAAAISLVMVAGLSLAIIRDAGDGTFGLGEEEPIELVARTVPQEEDVVRDAHVVAHTWGTEIVLELDGLTEGDVFAVMLRTNDGLVDAGSFLGTGEVVSCRLNGAAMRRDVVGVVITNSAGTEILDADLS